jgi:hypothetical protein
LTEISPLPADVLCESMIASVPDARTGSVLTNFTFKHFASGGRSLLRWCRSIRAKPSAGRFGAAGKACELSPSGFERNDFLSVSDREPLSTGQLRAAGFCWLSAFNAC